MSEQSIWGSPSGRQMLWPRRWPMVTLRATRWRTGASIVQPEIMSRLLLAMENRAWLRRRTLDALAKEPHLFERLLAVHAGTCFSSDFRFRQFLQVRLEAARQPQLKIPI